MKNQENMVIAIDGFSGTGKTTIANELCKTHNNFIHIELSELTKILVPFWIMQKNNAINLIRDLEIKYYVNNKKVYFNIKKDIPVVKMSKEQIRNKICDMFQNDHVKEKIFSELTCIINELKKKYVVIIVGRELQFLKLNPDLHFLFKAEKSDRIIRIINRDNITEEEAQRREELEEKITCFSNNVITLNTSRLQVENLLRLISNLLSINKLGISKKTKIKIQMLGAPSTGKTTICNLLSIRLNGVCSDEKLRIYLQNNNIPFSKLNSFKTSDWYKIIKFQIENENRIIAESTKNVFGDGGTLLYALDFNLLGDIQINDLVNEQLNNSDIIFVCDNDIEYVEDGYRPRKQEFNLEQCQKRIINYLNEKNILYFILSGSIEERFETARCILKNYIVE